ncbi:MAG: FkbM family methyltransferase [Elusimicrobia bacterium]|nr:FkbM family methyltransferase [Elusimicrobiota bacterium]
MIRRLLRSVWFSRLGELVFKRTITRHFPPRAQLLLAACTGSLFEEDLALVPYLCREDGVSVDVGAHFGLYTHHMAKHSRLVYAFEPIPAYAESLRRSFKTVVVEAAALSDRAGQCRLRVPEANPTWATMESENRLLKIAPEGRIVELAVPCRRLDDYALDGVAFVKIDVEGHELSVLKGARATLERDHPSLLVELEDMHHPGIIAEAAGFLAGLGYEGFFLKEGRLHPIGEFDPAKHQKDESHGTYGRRGDYILNFAFVLPQTKSRLAPFFKPASP